MILTPQQISECRAVASRRKQAGKHRPSSSGRSTLDQETMSVMSEYAFALAMGWTEEMASEHIARLSPTPGYQFVIGRHAIKICSTGLSSRKLIVKANRLAADFYVLAKVDEDEVHFPGWAYLEYLTANDPVPGNWGDNYEVGERSLNKLEHLFRVLQ